MKNGETNMKKILIILITIAFILSACKENIIETIPDNLQGELQTMLENEYASYTKDNPDFVGGFALQIKSKRGNYFVSKGMGKNITNQIHFRAASNTKTFTSAGILLLYQRGLLNINSFITDTIPGTTELFIPDLPEFNIPYKNEITIWQLLSHRAGVFDVTNTSIPNTVLANVPYKGKLYLEYIMATDPNHTFTFDELLGVVAICELSYFPPGTDYHYSNQGYSLLGKIIERVSGKTYKQFMMDEFVNPLGLTGTTFPDKGDDQIIPNPFVNGYIQAEQLGILDVTESNMSGNVAEGNLLTTADDLSKFIRMLLKGDGGLNLNTINNTMMDCRATGDVGAGGYGAGLMHWNNMGYGHNGAHEGFLSYMVGDPENDLAIVLFTNSWNFNNGYASFGTELHLLEQMCRQVKSIVVNE